MSIIEISLLAIGLAMDAFAVSIAQGPLLLRKHKCKRYVLPALFGFFQFLMPLIGWVLGIQFAHMIDAYDHWIIFIILAYLGGQMIYEALRGEEEATQAASWLNALVLAVATSIDALAIGVTLAFLHVDIVYTSALIGIITFIISLIGIFMGLQLGRWLQGKAEILGGLVLIGIGCKVLLEHLALW